VACHVIAPSLIPAKPGDRIKTDRRDAIKLAELFRAGLLTDVRMPLASEEEVRDLCRAGEAARKDATAAKSRLRKCLFRHGKRCSSRAWTQAWRKWLREIEWEHEAKG